MYNYVKSIFDVGLEDFLNGAKMANQNPRDTWLYELKDGNEIVYYGITNGPDDRMGEHVRSGKDFTHMNVKTVALTRVSAERRETQEIQRYQRQHGGKPPRYNRSKTY